MVCGVVLFQVSLAKPSWPLWPGTTSVCDGAGLSGGASGGAQHDSGAGDYRRACGRLGLCLLGWAPLAGGFLASDGNAGSGGDAGSGGPFDTAENRARRARAAALGAAKGLSVAQVAVAFAVGSGNAACGALAVCGTLREGRLAELAAAAVVRLTRRELRHLSHGD